MPKLFDGGFLAGVVRMAEVEAEKMAVFALGRKDRARRGADAVGQGMRVHGQGIAARGQFKPQELAALRAR